VTHRNQEPTANCAKRVQKRIPWIRIKIYPIISDSANYDDKDFIYVNDAIQMPITCKK
jgi:hypothetical protein